MNQSPFNICLQGWVGVPVNLSGTVTTPVVYAPDGVTIVTPAAPIDISGWTFRFTVKARYGDPDSAALFQQVWQIAAGAGTSGVWSAPEMPSTDTIELKSGSTLVWDIQYIPLGATEPAMFATGTIGIGDTVGTTLFTVPTP